VKNTATPSVARSVVSASSALSSRTLSAATVGALQSADEDVVKAEWLVGFARPPPAVDSST